jgi:hypothetical protein
MNRQNEDGSFTVKNQCPWCGSSRVFASASKEPNGDGRYAAWTMCAGEFCTINGPFVYADSPLTEQYAIAAWENRPKPARLQPIGFLQMLRREYGD